jgi:hypothetical protein
MMQVRDWAQFDCTDDEESFRKLPSNSIGGCGPAGFLARAVCALRLMFKASSIGVVSKVKDICCGY